MPRKGLTRPEIGVTGTEIGIADKEVSGRKGFSSALLGSIEAMSCCQFLATTLSLWSVDVAALSDPLTLLELVQQ